MTESDRDTLEEVVNGVKPKPLSMHLAARNAAVLYERMIEARAYARESRGEVVDHNSYAAGVYDGQVELIDSLLGKGADPAPSA